MAEAPLQATARIYQFPVRHIFEATRQLGRRSAADLAVPPYPATEAGSGWYHEAAIRDAEKPRKV